MPVFDDETIENIFGADDAENERSDRFVQYFYFNNAYASITSNLPIRILVGHKGVGKSALLKRAFLANEEKNKFSVWLASDQLAEATFDAKKSEDFSHRIDLWKRRLIFSILYPLAEEVYGNRSSSVIDALVESSSNELKRILFRMVKEEVLGGTLDVFIDDIDRGWSASTEDVANISALLNAIRDIVGSDREIRFKIGLRTDVYYLVRTSDESTDKIERNVVWLRWDNDDILRLAAKRIITYFNLDIDDSKLRNYRQIDISNNILSRVIEPVFSRGKGHWAERPIHNVLLSLTRARPRDLVKLFHGSAKRAYLSNSKIITSANLEDSFEGYSQERLQDIINEFKSELPDIDKLLLNMRPTKKQRKASENYLYTTDTMSEKIQGIMSHVRLYFRNGRHVNPKSLHQFLYKIDFITARLDREDGIDRKYFDESRFLAPDIVDFGYKWEVHPAYRWALQPQDVNSILDSLEL